MFDILDNPTTFSYAQNSNSRSSSAKKIQKSQYKNASSIESKGFSNNNNNRFDGMLDSSYEKGRKNTSIPNKNSSLDSAPRNNFESLNVNFGDIAKSKEINNNFNSQGLKRLSLLRNSLSESQEDQLLNQNFGQTQNTIFNPSKVQESFISTRNMRPPINRKETSNLNQSNGIILEQQATITNSSHKHTDNKQKDDKKLKRRSSIDSNSDIYDAQSVTNIFQTNDPKMNRFDMIKEDKFRNNQSQSNYQSENQMTFYNDKSRFNQSEIKNHANIPNDRHENSKQDHKALQNLKIQNKETAQRYEKDIQYLKEKNAQQMKYLQQSLNSKIKQNSEIRDYYIKQTNKIIEQQRARTKKVYEEQINRLKEMLQWEKERLKSTYTLQIETLKKTINYNQKFSSLQLNQTHSNHKHHWETEEELKFKAASLGQKQKQVEQRQNDVQFKWQELISTKRYDEERLRQEQKRLYQSQTSQKKYLMQQKRQLAEQKRQMSVQMGNLQLQFAKRKQDMNLKIQEMNLEAQILQKQRQEWQYMNEEMMKKHKQQAQSLVKDRQNLKELEIQLIKKIQIVELKARSQFYNEQDQFQRHSCQLRLKENINQPEKISIKKQLEKSKNTQSMLQIHKTKVKFLEMKEGLNGKVQMTLKENKKLDISRYMQKMNNQNKTRQYF